MELQSMIEDTLDNLKTVVNTSNIIGHPVTVGGKIIVPISRVTFGFMTGGGEYPDFEKQDERYPYAGGSGGGVNVTPIGILLCENDTHKFIRLNRNDEENKWVELIEAGLKVVQDTKKKE